MIWSKVSKSAFTLIELVMVILLISALATYLYSEFDYSTDAARFEATRAKMKALNNAIMGMETSGDNESRRISYGFFGDIGRLPSSLGELTTQGALPSWAFNNTYGVGAGWRGPYVAPTDSSSSSSFLDAWGNAIVLNTAASPPTLTSLGADGSSGGAIYNTDLVVTFPTEKRLSSVTGILTDFNTKQSGKTVDIRYPVNGVLTSSTQATDANGYYSFTSVPFGIRAIGVTSAPTIAHQSLVVSRTDISVSDVTLGYRGASEAVTFESGSAKLYDSDETVVVLLTSTYTKTSQLQSINISWSGGGNYTVLKLNGVDETFSSTPSGNDRAIGATMTILPKSSSNSLEIEFSGSKSGVAITIVFTWLNRSRTDSVTFTP